MTKQQVQMMIKNGWQVHNMRSTDKNVRPIQCWVKTSGGQ